MRTLKTSEAASLLNVSPNTLRAWERRFGYPKPQRSAGKHRLYTHGEIAALRDALHEGLSISSAISVAREALSSETHSLLGALSSFELDRADAAMEAALAMRSLERTVEEILLPTLEELGNRQGLDSAPWAHAVYWANAWLRRAQRLAPPPTRPISVIVGDATRDELDPDAPAVRALELLCARAGTHVLTLPIRSLAGLGDLLSTQRADAVVIAGSHGADDDVARWAYAVRAACGARPIALYRRTRRGERLRASSTARVLPDSPLKAQHSLIELMFTGESLVPALKPVRRQSSAPVNGLPVRKRVLA